MATTLYEIPLNSYPESFSIEIQGQPFFPADALERADAAVGA